MLHRTYHLYVKGGDGPFEIVPSGWSFLAAILGPLWAIANGVLLRYLLWMLTAIPVAVVSAALGPPVSAWLFAAYSVGLFVVYLPMKVFGWRASLLVREGYELRASVVARSSRAALRSYAMSV